MKYWMIILCFACCVNLNAQDVNVNGVVYTVKKDAILKEGNDVTNLLSMEEQQNIRATLERIGAEADEVEKREKALKRAEKEQKKAESKQKAAEKALKKKEKAQSNFEKAGKKHKEAISKYEKLKKKGKLSPADEGKWLKKIENYKKNLDKAKRKM